MEELTKVTKKKADDPGKELAAGGGEGCNETRCTALARRKVDETMDVDHCVVFGSGWRVRRE